MRLRGMCIRSAECCGSAKIFTIFSAYSRVFVVSLGKAGHTMVEALAEQVGAFSLEGIVATSVEPGAQVRGFRYFQGGHPTPNAESIRAASTMLKFAGADGVVAGDFSAQWRRIVDCGEAHRRRNLARRSIATYRALVHSGAPIAEINAIRKHLSAVKGGRLAQAAFPAQQVSLLVSDVPDNTPDALASGPTMPDSTSVGRLLPHCGEVWPAAAFPAVDARIVRAARTRRNSQVGRSGVLPFALVAAALESTGSGAGQPCGEQAGFTVHVDNSCDDWDYERAADYLVKRVRELRKESERVCLISGGEVTVKVTNGGVGGRNQQFALACAEKIAGENITVLSAGTDGIDGNSPAAGAVADGSTLSRAQARGLDARAALEKFDAYPFFNALGDAIETGPTGNNLRDLRILLAY